MKSLKVFNGVSIPYDLAATQTYALLAKRDGGKTYTTLLMEEQMEEHGLFFVTLDPVGKHWALRVNADGSPSGRDVWVLGGQHGDVPLDPKSGELIADVVVDHPGRYVLDVSIFESDAEVDRFALAFAKRLFRRKMRDPDVPLLLILEEAETFIPEKYQSGQQQMLGAFGRIVRQGRNHGLGCWMVAQRSQAINKGVLSQAEVLVVKQMAAKRDRDKVKEWAEANEGTPGQLAEMMGALASLEQNEAYVWSPSWLRVFKRVTVPQRVTFDSSASVKSGTKMAKVEISPLDIKDLGEKMAEVSKRAQSDDPKVLKKQLVELQRAVRLANEKTAVTQESGASKQELDAAKDASYEAGYEKGYEKRSQAEDVVVSQLASTIRSAMILMDDKIGPSLLELHDLLEAKMPDLPSSAPTASRPLPENVRSRQPMRRSESVSFAPSGSASPRAAPRSSGDANGKVSRPQQRILDALAMLEHIGVSVADRTQLALFSKQSPTSGGYFNNLSSLRTAGKIDYPSPGKAALTVEGRALADSSQAPSTTDELHEFVFNLVKPAKAKIVQALIDAYPEAMTRDELAAEVGASPTSGGYFNNLSSLRTLGLIDYPAPGMAIAQPVLFLDS